MSDHLFDRDRIAQHVASIFANDLHVKRVASLANAALGIHAIGRALAFAAGLKSRHAVKQVDRAARSRTLRPRRYASSRRSSSSRAWAASHWASFSSSSARAAACRSMNGLARANSW
jgi:hypothetical protein